MTIASRRTDIYHEKIFFYYIVMKFNDLRCMSYSPDAPKSQIFYVFLMNYSAFGMLLPLFQALGADIRVYKSTRTPSYVG
jgi:hypothetical protein